MSALNAKQRNRKFPRSVLASGWQECEPLTLQSTYGEIPHGRELSFSWLTGTVMTGLTGVLLMGAALYVAFEGQATFSTAYEALRYPAASSPAPPALSVKTSRARPVTSTHSDVETVVASIRENDHGQGIVRNEPFTRIQATLATVATSLSSDAPTYDPLTLPTSADPTSVDAGMTAISTDLYGADVGGEVTVHLERWPNTFTPSRSISDQMAADYVRGQVGGSFTEGEPTDTGSGISDPPLGDLIAVPTNIGPGAAENVTVMAKSRAADDAGLGRTERILTLKETSPLDATLLKNGFTEGMSAAIGETLKNVFPSTDLPQGARLRILFGPSRNSDTLIPYRMSIYVEDKHAATVALTDQGRYVLGTAPPAIKFPSDDTENISVASLPTLYRSIWETGRKHDIPDDVIKRIEGMYAYDVDLTARITPGDQISILETKPGADGRQELLYVGLMLGGKAHELFRFTTDQGVTNFFDPNGESGKPFLERRPLQGGGVNISSVFGWRIHPIFHTRKFHEGVDFASQTGIPIYAAGDGVVEKAGWSGGYGNFVELKHVNGFETGYGHMSKIANATVPGAAVRQGQIIGYVGSTGNSTGPHLHFEVRINGNFVDPISVKLPPDKTLPAQYEQEFAQTVSQVRDLLGRTAAPDRGRHQ
jgi:murein DD-endopeptidase MepM/ murein hydrolase activator NlpD